MNHGQDHESAEIAVCKNGDSMMLVVTESEEMRLPLYEKIRRFCHQEGIEFDPDDLHETDFWVGNFHKKEDLDKVVAWLKSLGATDKKDRMKKAG